MMNQIQKMTTYKILLNSFKNLKLEGGYEKHAYGHSFDPYIN